MARSDSRRPRAVAVVLVSAVTTLLACNAIVGLDDFHKGQCPGADCGTTSPDVVVPSDDGGDAKPPPPGSDPVSWARWPMPNYPVDGGFLPRLPSYAVEGTAPNDYTKDLVTGLVWRRATLAQATEDGARAACASLDPATGPWRLPKRIELVSLVDYSRSGILIDTTAFPGVKNVQVWTSSEVRPTTGAPNQPYWTVNFATGEVAPLAGDLVANVLCAKGK